MIEILKSPAKYFQTAALNMWEDLKENMNIMKRK